MAALVYTPHSFVMEDHWEAILAALSQATTTKKPLPDLAVPYIAKAALRGVCNSFYYPLHITLTDGGHVACSESVSPSSGWK